MQFIIAPSWGRNNTLSLWWPPRQDGGVLSNGENYHLSFWISLHTQWRAWRTWVARPCYCRLWAGHKQGLSWCSWFMRIMCHLPCTLPFSPGVYAETHEHRTTAGQWVFQITHLPMMFQSTSSKDIPSTFSWRGKKRNRFLKFQVSENICLLTRLCSPRDDPGIREPSRVWEGDWHPWCAWKENTN